MQTTLHCLRTGLAIRHLCARKSVTFGVRLYAHRLGESNKGSEYIPFASRCNELHTNASPGS